MNPIRHTRKDELLTARMNMPGTGKTAYSEVLDAGQTGGIDEMSIVIEHENLPSLAAGKKITLTLEASGDGDSWAEVPGFPGPHGGRRSGSSCERHRRTGSLWHGTLHPAQGCGRHRQRRQYRRQM